MWRQLTRCFNSSAGVIQSHSGINSFFAKHYSKYSDYGRQLGGFEYKDTVESGFRSKWRTPFVERDWFWKSKLSAFGSNSFAGGLTKYNPKNWGLTSWRNWYNGHAMEKLKYDQRFIKDRLMILGAELAAAHFVVYRGGAARFQNHSNWIRDDKKKNREYHDELPTSYKPGYILEAIDCSETPIIYEGLTNLQNLQRLKWISFAKCPHFDNWYLDRISGEYGESLEYLDISYTNVTHHALNALYRFKNLKTLKVEGISRNPEFALTCIEMKKYLSDLTIEGMSLETLSQEFEDEDNKLDHSHDKPNKVSLPAP